MRWTRKLGPLRFVVERTTCVVRASTTKDVLINAANESLAGAQLPYLPRGGPCPPPLPKGIDNANSWRALETGPGFVFREQAVDSVVTSLGGKALRDLCARARPDAGYGLLGLGAHALPAQHPAHTHSSNRRVNGEAARGDVAHSTPNFPQLTLPSGDCASHSSAQPTTATSPPAASTAA